MKKRSLLKTMLLLCALIAGSSSVWSQAPVNTVLWSEDFSGFDNNVDPSGDYTNNSHDGTTVYGSVTVTYSKDNGGGTTQTYTSGGPNDNNNLLIAKNNGTFSISGISTGQATELTVTYAKSGDGVIAISSSTTGVTISGSTSGSTITTNGATTLQLTFKNTGSKNLRIDDISVKVKTAGTGGGGVAAPTFSVPEGAVTAGTTVELEQANNKTIRYTTDGSNPSKTTGTVYSSAITITSPVTIKAIAVDGDNVSLVSSATYTISVAKPTFDVAAGAVEKGTSLTITATAGKIIYTTDGTDPSYASQNGDVYDSPITINSAMTVKAIAVDAYDNESDITSATYTIKKVVTPTFSVAEGAVLTGTMLALSTTTPDAVIHYTTDGTEPTASSPTYSSDIVIDANMTVKAIAVKDNWDNSDVASATYTVVTPVPGLAIDFEVGSLDQYTDWVFENVGNTNTAITAHGGSKYGANVNGSGNGVTSCFIKTKNKIVYPGKITFFVSKTSGNTTASSWYVEVSENGTSWTQVGDAQSATSMSKGAWVEVSRDLTSYSNVYVRIRYGSSNAVRAIDDIVLTENSANVSTLANRSYGSYVTTRKLDFGNTPGITAYIATGFNGAKDAIVLQEVSVVPAGTAIIVKTDEHDAAVTINVPVTDADASDVSANKLVAGDGTTAWDGTAGYTYYFLKEDQFLKATSGTLKSGKAYFKVLTSEVATTAPALGFDFGEGTTSIDASLIDNGGMVNDNVIYDLSGRRVAQPTKGLYIVNGKKVIIK